MKNFTYKSDISLEEAEIISHEIHEENKEKWDHMIPIAPTDLLNSFDTIWGIKALYNGKIAGIIRLMDLDPQNKIYECGSLIVRKGFRGNKIASNLIAEIQKQFEDLSILTVTNVPSVKHIYTAHLAQKDASKDELWTLLPIIEWPQLLLPDDSVYVNTSLNNRIIQWEFK